MALKIPTITTLIGSVLTTIRRFPLTVLCALAGACILIYMTHNEWRMNRNSLYYTLGKVLMCCELGLPLFMGCALLSEARKQSRIQMWVLQLVALALVTIYYFTLGDLDSFNMVRVARYLLFIMTVHLFVSFAPFLIFGQLNGFWQYNKTLFLRFLLAGLYTAVLFGGIALALWSIDELLKITVNYKKYLYTWYLLACVFNTLFFLAGIPANIEELENDESYFKGLKVFTQYVLLPLVTLYLLILYAYIGKMLVQWRLPKGLVSYLVIGYSVAGIFSLLLIYPIRHEEDNKWIKIFSRWFYLALFPLIIMLSISIFNRVAEYGITENRYFILVLALWLFGIATYFLNGTKENIKVIPISLAILALLTSFGPWGAFSVSEHSQKNHLEEILIKNKILVNGKIDNKKEHDISAEESSEIWSVIEYLNSSDALNLIQPWYNFKIDTLKYSKVSTVIDEMKLLSKNDKDWQTVYISRRENNEYSNLYSINIKGFENYSVLQTGYIDRYNDTAAKPDTIAIGYFMVGGDSISIYPQHNTDTLLLKRKKAVVAKFNLNAYLNKLTEKYDTNNSSYHDIYLPANKLTLDIESDTLFFRFMFKTINMEKSRNKIHLKELEADVLSKHK